MRKPLLISVLAIVIGLSSLTPASAAGTTVGPFGPASFQDYGTCGNPWANFTTKSKYNVGKLNNDGSYNVRLTISGSFVTVAGQGPGACFPSADGYLVNAGVKGHATLVIYLAVSGGTFNPAALCDSTCAFDGYLTNYTPISHFAQVFFGQNATWSFSSVRDHTEKATSRNPALCANNFSAIFRLNPDFITSSTGDIATYCPP